MIVPGTFYTVQSWMVNDLKLKGNALALYAIIYGFSQDGQSVYAGSARYLAEWLGCSRTTVMTTLKDLVEKELLEKNTIYQNGVAYCTYKTVPGRCTETLQGVQNLNRGCTDFEQNPVQNLNRGCTDSVHNKDIDNYIDNNKDIYIGADAPTLPADEGKKKAKKQPKEKPPKHQYGEYKHVLLTDDERDKLLAKHGEETTALLIQYLDEYIEEKHYKSRSHYLAITRWVLDAVNEREQRAARRKRTAGAGRPANVGPNGIAIDPTQTDMDGCFK